MRKTAILILAAVAAAAVSCVYSYEADLNAEAGEYLVVEGEIIPGEVSDFSVSYMLPLNTVEVVSVSYPLIDISVESESGAVYEGTRKVSMNYTVDLSGAPVDEKYRLRIKNLDNSRNYSSEWMDALSPCVIDSVFYKINEDETTLSVRASVTGQDSRYFRYKYVEDWEYHSLVRASLYYDVEKDTLLPYQNNENIYFCWKHDESRGLLPVSTAEVAENKVVGYELTSFGSQDDRAQMLYRIDFTVYPISEDSYRYYDHLNSVSQYSGSLFEPNPSEMRGNLRCDEDPDEMVIGYVGVCRGSTLRTYIDNGDTGFYDQPASHYETEQVEREEWYRYFIYMNWYPVYGDPLQGYYWAKRNCVDCRYSGGTKNVPDGWPNTHK